MTETRDPVLVYNRITSNKRNTRRLIAAFGIILTPALSACTMLLLPWMAFLGAAAAFLIFGSSLREGLDTLDQQLDASAPSRLSDLPPTVLWIIGGLLLAALVVVLLIFCGITALLIARYGSRLVLRAAGAVPADPKMDRELIRVFENLSIGAGLPAPSVHILESSAPNAFAIGRDPSHASLAVTRGLLTLLDRRQLEGVIAHELSHIGNHDIRLATALASLTAVVTAPLRAFVAVFRVAYGVHFILGALLSCFAVAFVVSAVNSAVEVFSMPHDAESLREMPMFLRWWALHALLSPLYAALIAPPLAAWTRWAIAREREFLADADAVLITRDPEGLAMALEKIGKARGERLRVSEASVHVYFVDPLEDSGSWWHRVFPSHPPLSARIEMLLRMGSGSQFFRLPA